MIIIGHVLKNDPRYDWLEDCLEDQRYKSYYDIDQYFNTEVVGFTANIRDNHTQVQNWWNSNKSEFPCMTAEARDYLAIPSSEVDIERLFSDGRDILGIQRFALQGATITDLMVCKDELRRKKSRQI